MFGSNASKLRKIKDKASKLFGEHKFSAALKAYEEVLQLAPDEIACRMKVGDIHRRLEHKEQAIEAYQVVASAYASDGLLLKAIAVTKLILELDPNHPEAQRLMTTLQGERKSQAPAGRSPSFVPKSKDAGLVPPRDIPVSDTKPRPASATGLMTAALRADDAPLELDVPADASGTSASARSRSDSMTRALDAHKIPLFSDLPKEAFVDLLVQMTHHHYQNGQLVVRQGNRGSSFFVLVSGRVEVFRMEKNGSNLVLAHLEEGAFFGEMALLQGGPRTASVRSLGETEAFEFKRDVLESLVQRFPSVAQVLQNFYRQRLLSTLMATSPLFRGFDAKARVDLMSRFVGENRKQGERPVQKGEMASGLFVVLSGSLDVLVQDGEAPIASLGVGDLFGETSLLTGQPAGASVVAKTPCHLLRLPKKQFDELIMTHPQVLELVSQLSEERRSANALFEGVPVSVGDRDEPLRLF